VLGTNARTITAWINASNSQVNNASFISYGTNATGQRMTLRLDTTNGYTLRAEVQSAAAEGSTPLNDGQWHHVAMTIPSGGYVSNILLYVDGKSETVNPVAGGTLINTVDANAQAFVMFGNSAVNTNTYGFNGSIDDVRFYTNVLTATQIGEVAFGRSPFLPFTLPAETFTFSQQSGGPVLNWPGNWVLQTNSVLDNSAPWGDLPGATSPYTIPVSPQGNLFFRIRSP
jgi:hypothetical protein